MGIFESARINAKRYSQQREITLSNGTNTYSVKAIIADITEKFDENGHIVNSRKAHLCIHEDVLIDAGLTQSSLNLMFVVIGSKKYQITQRMTNATTGLIPCYLKDVI